MRFGYVLNLIPTTFKLTFSFSFAILERKRDGKVGRIVLVGVMITKVAYKEVV